MPKTSLERLTQSVVFQRRYAQAALAGIEFRCTSGPVDSWHWTHHDLKTWIGPYFKKGRAVNAALNWLEKNS